jgi:hypothetical protein
MVKLTKYRNIARREGWIFRRDGGGKMDGATLYIKQLKPYLYLLDEEHQATGYLVIGENKAVLIDTMNGLTNLRAEVEKLTDKPGSDRIL